MSLPRLLGEILVEHGAITPHQLEEALSYQKQMAEAESKETFSLVDFIKIARTGDIDPSNRLLGEIVVKKGYTSALEVQQAIQLQQEQFDLTKQLDEHQLRTLLGISTAMNSTISLIDLLTLIMEATNRVMEAEASSLMLLDNKTGELVFTVPTGPKKDEITEIRLPTDRGIAGWVFKHNEPLLIPDVEKDPRFFSGFDESFDFKTRSIICVPLLIKGKIRGVLEVLNKKNGSRFDESDLYLLRTFANQAGIALENARLRLEAVERQRLRQELVIANQIQTCLLPARSPSLSGIDVSGYLRPATEISGDFYDFIELDGNRLAVVIGDISGKGISAGLLMAASRCSLRTRIENLISIAPAVNEVNRMLLRDNVHRFISLFLGLINVEEKTLSYTNCGHMPGLLFRKRSGRIEELSVGGTVLGVFEDFSYDEETLSIEEGDTLVLYTDGVLEEKGPDGVCFGSERLARLVEDNAGRSAQEITKAIAKSVLNFTGGDSQGDDVAIVAARLI